MTPFFSESLWPGLLVWILLFISDYSLTIYCARLYQTRAKDKIAIEGSYELTPFYQGDIDALKRISPRFLFAICTASLVLGLIWFVARGNPLVELAYQFALGALNLTQMAVHIRHLRAVAAHSFLGMEIPAPWLAGQKVQSDPDRRPATRPPLGPFAPSETGSFPVAPRSLGALESTPVRR